jgi:hypothetical protein
MISDVSLHGQLTVLLLDLLQDRNIMEEGRVEESCSTHTGQKAERWRGRAEDKIPFKGIPQRPTSSKKAAQPNVFTTSKIVPPACDKAINTSAIITGKVLALCLKDLFFLFFLAVSHGKKGKTAP